MEFSAEELQVISSYEEEMLKCFDRDCINKLYRQARIWNRFHHFFGNGCTVEVYRELNATFKRVRVVRLRMIEEV